MSAVLTDTHALLWYMNNSSRLSATARAATAEQTHNFIYVPSIILVELRYLIEKGTISDSDYQTILTALKDDSTVLTIAPLGLREAESLSLIPRATVPDMPDRIIAATALAMGLPLVMRDSHIRVSTNITTVW
ncbi:MAG: PIN domain-containing protein [Acidobacteriota bacterium]